MKKLVFCIATCLLCFYSNAQKTKSEKEVKTTSSQTRQFIDNSLKTRINKDWSLAAEFKSGIGETVTFFPVQIVNLDSKNTIRAIELDMMTKQMTAPLAPAILNFSNVWIDYDEIDSFIAFIENNIVPNLDLKYKDKSSEFIFQAKELTLKFLIHEKRQRLTIEINDSDGQPFWTETQVDKFPKLLPMLKKVKNKELSF